MAAEGRDWGFTAEELATCVKVVTALHQRPELLVEDPDIQGLARLLATYTPKKYNPWGWWDPVYVLVGRGKVL